MSTKKNASAEPNDDAGETTPQKPKLASRGRNVQSWLEKTFGEGTGRDWPRALDQMFPLLQDLYKQHNMSLRDVRCYVTRLGGANGSETPVAPPFDASCMDTDQPAEAAQQYLEDYYHLPAAEAGGGGAATYRVSFKDKKTSLQIIAGEMGLLHPKEIHAIRRAHRRGHGESDPAYNGAPPHLSNARPPPAPGMGSAPTHASGGGDPYVLQALNDMRVDLANHKAQTPEVIAAVLQRLAPHLSATPQPQPQPTPPAAPQNTVETVIEVLRRMGIAKDVGGGGAGEDEIDRIVQRCEQTFRAKKRLDHVIREYTGMGDAGDGGGSSESGDVAAAAVAAPTPPEPKAPFRGLKIDGQPKYKGQDVLWPVDNDGNFSLKGVPFTNPQLWEDFLGVMKEGGKPVWELFARFMEQQTTPAPQHRATSNGTQQSVVDEVPADARDGNPGDGSNGAGSWGSAS